MADISKINVNNTEYNVKDSTARSKQIIEGQASGSIATFNDGGDNIPMKSCEVAIVAQQASGTPSPSTPLSITGVSSVVACVDKKVQRVIPTSLTMKSDSGITVAPISNGLYQIYGTATAVSYVEFDVPEFTIMGDDGKRVAFFNTFDNSNIRIVFMNGSTQIDTWSLTPTNRVSGYTGMANKVCNKVRITFTSGLTVNGTFRIEFYILDNHTTHTVSLGQTIYGGTAELVGGNGTKVWSDKYIITNDTVLSSFTQSAEYGAWARISSIGIQKISENEVCAKSDMATGITYADRLADPTKTRVFIDALGYVVIRARASDNITTESALKTLFMGAEIIYQLATPTAFTFTGANIPTLSGVNNVYADSGDVNELEYFNENADEIAELVNAYPYEVSGILATGQTSITLSSRLIKTTSTIDVYTDGGVNYNSISVANGSVTITFDAQASNLGVKVRVS